MGLCLSWLAPNSWLQEPVFLALELNRGDRPGCCASHGLLLVYEEVISTRAGATGKAAKNQARRGKGWLNQKTTKPQKDESASLLLLLSEVCSVNIRDSPDGHFWHVACSDTV